jgi:hypothetical protein
MSFSLPTLLENLFELLYPFATGVAINGLLSGSNSGLLLLVSVWLAAGRLAATCVNVEAANRG